MSAVALMKEKQLFPQPGSDGICGPVGFRCHASASVVYKGIEIGQLGQQ